MSAKNAASLLLMRLDWKGPVYEIAAINKQGTLKLAGDIMDFIEERNERTLADPEYAAEEEELKLRLEQEARERVQQFKLARHQQRLAAKGNDDLMMMIMTTTTMTLKSSTPMTSHSGCC